MGADSYDEDDEIEEGPKSSFSTYLAEGDVLFKQGEFKKALESYSLANDIQPEDRNCLVARSKCYLKLGDPQAALKDAEAALVEDKTFNKGLYQKAEALYSMGDFEYALMYYHRGHKLRPELDEFRLGIQKAQEAIDNSIGAAAKIKLENKGDLSFFSKGDELREPKTRGYTKPGTSKPKPIASRNKETKVNAPSKKTVKQLLGELYADKEYLDKLMQDEGFIKDRKKEELVESGQKYLETRTEFWRQQKPLYARGKDRTVKKSKSGVEKKKTKRIGKYIVEQLELIDNHLTSGEADKSLQVAQQTLTKVEAMSSEECPNKDDIIPNIYSCIGNAYVELGQLNKALKQHQKDLELSRKSDSDDGKSRALDNIGRVYARLGKYEQAVSNWTEKVPLLKSAMESAWLYHEIGRCYIELTDYEQARDFGGKSLAASQEANDQVWELNASVLVAQAEVKLGNVSEALFSFEQALKHAEALEDEGAQNAVTKALDDLKSRYPDSSSADASQKTAEPKTDTSENEAITAESKEEVSNNDDTSTKVEEDSTEKDENETTELSSESHGEEESTALNDESETVNSETETKPEETEDDSSVIKSDTDT